jgi:hypothetical protein
VSANEDKREVVSKFFQRVSKYSGDVQIMTESVRNGFDYCWKVSEGSRNIPEGSERLM